MPNRNITNFENFIVNFDTLNTKEIVCEDLKDQLLEIIPKFFNYEEEGVKLSFDVLILKDIEMMKKRLSTYLFQDVVSVKKDSLNLKKQIKSLAPFSTNGWSVFIAQESDGFVVGIYKDFTPVGALDISEVLKENYILIKKIDNEVLEFTNGLNQLYLHLSIVKKNLSFNRAINLRLQRTKMVQLPNTTTIITSSEKHQKKVANLSEKLKSYFNGGFKLYGEEDKQRALKVWKAFFNDRYFEGFLG